MYKTVRRNCIISNGYATSPLPLLFFCFGVTSGIIIEELVRECLGKDGHKAFVEDGEIEGGPNHKAEAKHVRDL